MESPPGKSHVAVGELFVDVAADVTEPLELLARRRRSKIEKVEDAGPPGSCESLRPNHLPRLGM